jgi:hypothetical protein
MKSVRTSLRIVHGVSYHFVEPISGLAIRTCLRPRSSVHWHCTFAQLLVQPEASETADSRDSHGNHVSDVDLCGSFQRIDLHHVCRLESNPGPSEPSLDLAAARGWEHFCREQNLMARESQRIQSDDRLAAFARQSFDAGRPILDCVRAFARQIREYVRYEPNSARGLNSAEVLETGKGVCEDFSHLAIAGLRSLGLPARYVSGYRIAGDQAKFILDPHAWVAVRLSDEDWLAFDPTVGELCGPDHVPIGWGRDREDVIPVSGKSAESVPHRLESRVTIERIARNEGPR